MANMHHGLILGIQISFKIKKPVKLFNNKSIILRGKSTRAPKIWKFYKIPTHLHIKSQQKTKKRRNF